MVATGVWAICLLTTGYEVLSSYVHWTLQALVLGIMGIVATARKGGGARPARYATAAVFILVLALWMPVKTFLFFGFALTIFYGFTGAGISLPFLSCAALFLSSPVFEYGVTAFSFPIRLKLASLTGDLFSIFGTGTEVKGNVIYARGFEFAVDPACMGLHMLSISLLLGIIFLGLLQKKWGRQLSASWSVFFLVTLVVLNIFSNFMRIVLLVQFRILPGTFWHDAIGLVCLLVYVCIPAAFLARRLLQKKGISPALAAPARPSGWMSWVLLLLMTAALVRVRTADTYSAFQSAARPMAGYNSSWYVPGVLKLQNDRSLVYIKFIRGFYDTEHNPSMCWAGSGYAFQDTREEAVAGGHIFTARLVRGSDSLYTAWWYSNGSNALTDQWKWRWALMRGEKAYAVVNLTMGSADALHEEVERLLRNKNFKPLIDSK